MALNTPGARAAVCATRRIPIVLIQAGDPAGGGFVTNLAQSGGNLTGASNMVADLASKRMEILKSMIPSGNRIAAIPDPGDPILNTARMLGMKIPTSVLLRVDRLID